MCAITANNRNQASTKNPCGALIKAYLINDSEIWKNNSKKKKSKSRSDLLTGFLDWKLGLVCQCGARHIVLPHILCSCKIP